MIRPAALTMLVTIVASGGWAQELPESAPETNIRPPERPAAVSPVTVPQDVTPPMIGPTQPPVWFTLAGSQDQFDACRLGLTVLGASFVPQPAQADPENRNCGIAYPLKITQILPGVALSGEPVMRCETALSLALWIRDFLQPAAALLPDAPRLTALQTGPAYTCRDRAGTGDADPKPSEHGYGNAIDVMGFSFDQGDPVPVSPRQETGDSAESFQRAARGTACLLFTTVLGPGSNAAHDNHLHLDMAARNNGWRLCQ